MDIDGIRNALLYIDDVRSVDLAEKNACVRNPFVVSYARILFIHYY